MADSKLKSEYEYNGDAWFYRGYEYHRGDTVQIPEDLDEPGRKHLEQLVEEGTLVEPGFAEKLREEQADAEAKAEERRLEQVEADDAEAHRRVAAQQRLMHGDPKVDDDSKEAAQKATSNEGSSARPAGRRSSSSK